MRKLTAIAFVLIAALASASCTKGQACYRDGKHDSRPPIPLALITRAAPALGIVARVY